MLKKLFLAISLIFTPFNLLAIDEVCSLPAEVLKHYNIIQWLGEGTQSTVYLAHDLEGNQVAIKTVYGRSGYLADVTEVQNEIRVSKTLQNVSSVRGFIEAINEEIIIMEYIQGYSLEERLENALSNTCPKEQYLAWLLELLTSLQEIVDQGVLPIDISADNILVDEATLQLRIIDIADFIDLNQYQSHTCQLQVYKNGAIVSLSSDDGNVHELPLTPTVVVRLTAKDLYHLANVLLQASGNKELPSIYAPKPTSFINDTTKYDDLALLHSQFSGYLQELMSAVLEIYNKGNL